MKIDQAIEEIRFYFNLDLMPHSRDRLKRILEQVAKDKIIEKVITKTVYLNVHEDQNKLMNIKEEANRIGLLYGTDLAEMQSKRRERNIVQARAHFARYVKLNSKHTITSIAKFLRRHHTSIIHLLYDQNISCAIGPLYKKSKTWQS